MPYVIVLVGLLLSGMFAVTNSSSIIQKAGAIITNGCVNSSSNNAGNIADATCQKSDSNRLTLSSLMTSNAKAKVGEKNRHSHHHENTKHGSLDYNNENHKISNSAITSQMNNTAMPFVLPFP
jgi:hypothetical protein